MDRRQEQRQAAFYRDCSASDSSDLHRWIAVWAGKGLVAGIPENDTRLYLQHVVSGRQGKTPIKTAYRDIDATVRNFYSKDGWKPRGGYCQKPQASASQDFIQRETAEQKRERQEKNRKKLTAFTGVTESTLIYRSPSRFPANPIAQSRYFLERMFYPDDVIFLAPQLEYAKKAEFTRPVAERLPELPRWSPGWIEHEKSEDVPQYLSLATFTGNWHDGSLTAQSCRVRQDYALIEFDNITLQEQRDVWLSLLSKLPIVSIVYSGNASYHVWIRLDGKKLAEQDAEVEQLYAKFVDNIGADPNKKGKATRARVPGSIRRGKDGTIERHSNGAPRFAHLVYFDEGLAVNEVIDEVEVEVIDEVAERDDRPELPF